MIKCRTGPAGTLRPGQLRDQRVIASALSPRNLMALSSGPLALGGGSLGHRHARLFCRNVASGVRGPVGADEGIIAAMRVGVAHHFGWAVAVTASADYQVVDRRQIELIEPGVPAAPIHHEGKSLDDAAAFDLVARVRASAVRATSASLDELASALHEPIVSVSLRAWPVDFPEDIAVQRRAPYESRADSIMYRQILAELVRARGWAVYFYDAKTVENQAAKILAERAEDVLYGPRARLGPPWARDHRMALAATIVAGGHRAARDAPEL